MLSAISFSSSDPNAFGILPIFTTQDKAFLSKLRLVYNQQYGPYSQSVKRCFLTQSMTSVSFASAMEMQVSAQP